MANLIRRNKIVPVTARRVTPEPEQVIVNTPAAAPAPQPPPPSAPPQSITQNIFYVNAPTAAPPPPATPLKQEIHLHTEIHYPPRQRSHQRDISWLGMVSLLAGGLSLAVSYVLPKEPVARQLAEAGLVAGALAWLIAILFRRSGAGIPIIGLIVSGLAWFFCTGYLSHVDPGTSTPPAKQPLENAVHPATPTIDNTPAHPAIKAPTVAATPIAPSANLTIAQANLESARITAAQRLGIDYTTAKSDADHAAAALQQLRITASPGSPELIAAAQQCLSADSKLKDVQDQLRADPTVASAEQRISSWR